VKRVSIVKSVSPSLRDSSNEQAIRWTNPFQPVPPFILYYQVIEKPPTVRILTIQHGARRQPKKFK
jgi:hypothetical protein